MYSCQIFCKCESVGRISWVRICLCHRSCHNPTACNRQHRSRVRHIGHLNCAIDSKSSVCDVMCNNHTVFCDRVYYASCIERRVCEMRSRAWQFKSAKCLGMMKSAKRHACKRSSASCSRVVFDLTSWCVDGRRLPCSCRDADVSQTVWLAVCDMYATERYRAKVYVPAFDDIFTSRSIDFAKDLICNDEPVFALCFYRLSCLVFSIWRDFKTSDGW